MTHDLLEFPLLFVQGCSYDDSKDFIYNFFTILHTISLMSLFLKHICALHKVLGPVMPVIVCMLDFGCSCSPIELTGTVLLLTSSLVPLK